MVSPITVMLARPIAGQHIVPIVNDRRITGSHKYQAATPPQHSPDLMSRTLKGVHVLQTTHGHNTIEHLALIGKIQSAPGTQVGLNLMIS